MKPPKQALSDYSQNKNGTSHADPTVDRDKLIAHILESVAAATALLREQSFDLLTLIAVTGLKKTHKKSIIYVNP